MSVLSEEPSAVAVLEHTVNPSLYKFCSLFYLSIIPFVFKEKLSKMPLKNSPCCLPPELISSLPSWLDFDVSCVVRDASMALCSVLNVQFLTGRHIRMARKPSNPQQVNQRLQDHGNGSEEKHQCQ